MINIRANSILFENIECIIFDKDGTLTDSHLYWSEIIKLRSGLICRDWKLSEQIYYDLLTQMGYDYTQDKLFPSGPIAIKNREEVVDTIYLFLKKSIPSISKLYLLECFSKVHQQFSLVASNYIKPIPSAVDKVQLFKSKGLKLALLTSDTEQNANTSLCSLGLTNVFDVVIGRDSGCGNKITGRPATHVTELLSTTPANTLAIGDAPMDYEMSINSQLAGCILVATGQIPLCQLIKYTQSSVATLDFISIDD